jgi:hypothetical protein
VGRVCGKPPCVLRGEKLTPMLSKHSRAKRDTSSIQARVVYAEHCARRGALSKANQAVTSNSMPNADPCNIDLLRAKHPEPAHPDRDPVRLSSILCPKPQTLEEYWSSDAGAEFISGSVSLKYASISARDHQGLQIPRSSKLDLCPRPRSSKLELCSSFLVYNIKIVRTGMLSPHSCVLTLGLPAFGSVAPTPSP